MVRVILLAVVAMVVIGVVLFSQPGARHYTLTKVIRVGPEPLGMAQSSDGKRLFVLNAANHSLSLIDLAAQSKAQKAQALRSSEGVVRTLGLPPGRPNSIALLAASNRLLITDAERDRLMVFDLECPGAFSTCAISLRASVAVGKHPQGVVVSKDQRWAFTADSASDSVTQVNLQNFTLERSFAVNERPNSLFMTKDGRLLVSTLAHTVDVIRPPNAQVKSFDFNDVARFMGVVASPDGRIFVADGLNDAVVEFAHDQTSALAPGRVAFGQEFNPTDVALSQDASKLFVVGRAGVLGVIDLASSRVVSTLVLGGDLRRLLLGHDGTLFVSDTAGGRVLMVRQASP